MLGGTGCVAGAIITVACVKAGTSPLPPLNDSKLQLLLLMPLSCCLLLLLRLLPLLLLLLPLQGGAGRPIAAAATAPKAGDVHGTNTRAHGLRRRRT